MDNPDNKPATLEERLIGAFISAIAMACSIAALSFVFFVISSRGHFAGLELFFHFVFSKISLFIIGGASVLGFFLKFDTMLNIFSSLWGTNPEYDIFSANKFVIVIAAAIAIVVAALLLRQ